MPDASDALEWRGRTAVDADGSKLGKSQQIATSSRPDDQRQARTATAMDADR